MDDLSIIEPAPRVETFGDREVTIAPVTVGQMPGIMRALKGIDIGDDLDVSALIADHGDGVMQAVSIATGVPIEEIRSSRLDAFTDLLNAVLEVNLDFFVRRVLPRIRGVLSRIGDGETPSNP